MFPKEAINIFKKIIAILPKAFRKKIIRHATGLTLLSIADFAGLAILLPLLILLLNSETEQQLPFSNLLSEPRFISFFLVFAALYFILKAIYSIFIYKKQVSIISKIIKVLSKGNLINFLNLDYEKRINTDTSLFYEKVYFQPLYIGQGVIVPLLTLFQESVVLILILVGLVAIYPFVSMGLFAVLLTSGIIVNKWIRKRSGALGSSNIKMRKTLFESLNLSSSGMIDIKQNLAQDEFADDISEKVRHLAEGELEANTLKIIPFRSNELIAVLGLIALICYALILKPDANFLIMGSIFALAVFKAIPSINRIQLNIVQIKLYSKHLEGIAMYSETETETTEMPELKSSIILENIKITYKDTGLPILDSVNMQIPIGSLTVFCGESGSGKSSLLRVIAGQMEQSSGSVLIDNEILNKENVNSWQTQVSLISQKPFISKGSIIDNITFGNNNGIELEKVKESLGMAGLSDFIPNLESRTIGEDGLKISEGQKQRLMLARAIYKQSKVLILDEITANLDFENTKTIMNTLRKLKNSGCTIIMSSHSDDIRNIADFIFLFKNGKIFKNEYSKSEN